MERRDENNRQNRECKKEETRPRLRLRQREKMKKEEALRQAKKGKFHGEGEKFALLTFLAALLIVSGITFYALSAKKLKSEQDVSAMEDVREEEEKETTGDPSTQPKGKAVALDEDGNPIEDSSSEETMSENNRLLLKEEVEKALAEGQKKSGKPVDEAQIRKIAEEVAGKLDAQGPVSEERKQEMIGLVQQNLPQILNGSLDPSQLVDKKEWKKLQDQLENAEKERDESLKKQSNALEEQRKKNEELEQNTSKLIEKSRQEAEYQRNADKAEMNERIEKGINDTKSSLDGLNLRAENLEAKLSGKSISVLSRAEYNAIAHDPETIYFITD
ncbi:MAG: hypothetical protein VZR29_03155 [Lachnospiraceae bacterium]|nr:hypothetical protein [Lachnospiraceae bacterium]